MGCKIVKTDKKQKQTNKHFQQYVQRNKLEKIKKNIPDKCCVEVFKDRNYEKIVKELFKIFFI